ncbi:MAG TPA: 1-phosphofructokinase family hexose kinase [Thermoleophilaceae bacterium]|nr:1-phosphofructokinase family hexose kinase [Thermoleophilaceae bacterium]
MILTVTLNAAIDRTLAVPNFHVGRRHRAVEQTAVAGGKGVNVARALKALGRPVLATGTAGGGTGARIIELLNEEGIANDFVRIQEESRMSTAVIDPTDGVTTEINERGPALSNAERERVVERILYLAQGAKIVVLCGSLPRGVPVELYAQLVEELRRLDVTTILDTEGEPLRLAVRSGPDLISPNLTEAEELVGHEFADDEDRVTGVRDIVTLGARNAIITYDSGCVALLGGDSAERVAYRVAVEPREPLSAIGAGDAFLAGYVARLYEGRGVEECLCFGTACGAESVRHVGAGVIDPREVERLLPEVTVDRLAEPAFLSP